MATVSENVPFYDLCNLCEKIAKRKGKEKKVLLQNFIEKWRKFHNELHKNNLETTDSFFPALRLLLPQCERQRAAYGIKEMTLAKLYVEILCLSKESTDAQKLLNYRSPKTAKGEAGDFASVAYFILNNRCPEKGSLKIYDVNFHLDNIATNNTNKTEVRNSLLLLLRNTTPLEQKWLIRMILKSLPLGIGEQTVLNSFHRDARDLYNVTNSLEKVCDKLKNPMVRLHEIEIEIFSPFRPMLADLAEPQKVMELMNNEPFMIEVKFDGERVQLHRCKSMYKYFSRGGHDCTSLYGGSPLVGSLTPYIADCFMSNVDNCILDGEMVIYSTKLNCIVSKGENAEVKFAEPDGDFGPCFCVFDILMLNDKVLTNHPFKERIKCLKNVFVPKENKIRLSEVKEANSREDVDTALNDAISNRQEGIVIKNALSIYRPNVRGGGGWLKIKPDYIFGLMNELDLLIIGGYFGEGRRANMISQFLLAVAVPANNTGSHPEEFMSITKVGSGYSMKELNELLEILTPHWEVYDINNPPQSIKFGAGRKNMPDVWIDPSKSRIVQVKASEIVRSDRFPVNCTLRFPRVEKIRYDKPWYQCLTTSELEVLRKEAKGHLATCSYSSLPNEPSPKKKKVHQGQMIAIAPHFRPTDVTDVQQESEILLGKELCVILSSLERKKILEKQIVKCGGRFVQNPGTETYCVLADKSTVKVKNIVSTKSYDVVKADWLSSCVKENKLLAWVPEDMLYTTPHTLEKFRKNFDEYGDNFYLDATEESLSKVFKNISPSEWQSHCLTKEDIVLLERKYFLNSSSCGLFRSCRIYLDGLLCIRNQTTEVKDHNKIILTSMKLRLYGGNICEEICDEVTHVVMHSNDAAKFQELSEISRKRTEPFYIISTTWVDECVAANELLSEKYFEIF